MVFGQSFERPAVVRTSSLLFLITSLQWGVQALPGPAESGWELSALSFPRALSVFSSGCQEHS